MKRINLLIVCAALAGMLVACGEKKEKTSSEGGKTYKTYQEACSAHDFEAAHEFLVDLYDEFESTWDKYYDELNYKNNYRERIEKAATHYSNAAKDILSAEVRYLISEYGSDANDRISFLLNENIILGEKVIGEGYHPHGVDYLQQACAKIDCYKQTVKYNNAVCDVVLNLAILNKDQELAKTAISYYMQNCTKLDTSKHDNIAYTDADKEAAQRKYQEAIANGAFN